MAYTKLEDIFGDLIIDDSFFEEIRKKKTNQKDYEELLKTNPNLVVLSETLEYLKLGDAEIDDLPKKLKAFINLIRIFMLEFSNDPYWNSRIGWLMWFWTCYARYDSYYPMAWCFHYDPLNWYRSDEPMRPPELERILPDDPFNVQGRCFINPNWYKLKEEHGRDNWNKPIGNTPSGESDATKDTDG